MRAAFLTAVMTGSILGMQTAPVEAAPRVKLAKVKNVAYTEPVTQGSGLCSQDAQRRVRVDAVIDLESGERLYTNLSDDDFNRKPVHPASLTKLEGVKEMIRRVQSGIWSKDKTFDVAARPKEKVYPRALADIARMSLVTSFNVMDSIAKKDPSFMDNIRAYTRQIGMGNTTYFSPTGDPNDAFPDVRTKHLTTAANLIVSIRDYYLNYADPAKLQDVFGVKRISGLPSISDIPGLPRDTSTLTLLENAIGKKAHPVAGVTDGKTGYTCAAGWGEFVKYEFNQRSYIVMTLGHASAAERQMQALKLIEAHRPAMTTFNEKVQAQRLAARAAEAAATTRAAMALTHVVAPPDAPEPSASVDAAGSLVYTPD